MQTTTKRPPSSVNDKNSVRPIEVVEKVVQLLSRTIPGLGNGKQDNGYGLDMMREGVVIAHNAMLHGFLERDRGIRDLDRKSFQRLRSVTLTLSQAVGQIP